LKKKKRKFPAGPGEATETQFTFASEYRWFDFIGFGFHD
jgi:hypothetical protein